MKNVADFQRAATPGSVWRCEHIQRPSVSGLRTVTKGKGVLSYTFEYEDGRKGTNGRLEIPKASEAIVEGESVKFLDKPGGEVIFVWTRVEGK